MFKILSKSFEQMLTRSYMRIYGISHPIQKKILFSSFSGRQYSDNPRAICEKMHELFPQYELVWYLKDATDKYGIIPDYVRVISSGLTSFYKELATAFCYITNEAIEPSVYKRKNQYFIQTWHGDRAFKKILYDVWDEKGKERPTEVIDGKVTDLCIAGSDFGCKVYKSAFRYYGEILCSGSPRNDRLVHVRKEDADAIKKRLNLNSRKKILLYAPTYRDSFREKRQEIELNLNSVLDKLEEGGDNWVCLLRAHSCSMGLNNLSYNDQERFRDVTDYPDMTDLLCSTDFLITDYSSCACDFVLLHRPVVLYISDKDEYQKSSRSFKVDPEKVGFYTASNTEELLNLIDSKTIEDFAESCERVADYYGTVETGHAAEEVCNMIYEFFENRGGYLAKYSTGFSSRRAGVPNCLLV